MTFPGMKTVPYPPVDQDNGTFFQTTTTQDNELGLCVTDSQGREFMYVCNTGGAAAAGDVASLTATGTVSVVGNANLAMGVYVTAVANNEYCWIQTCGPNIADVNIEDGIAITAGEALYCDAANPGHLTDYAGQGSVPQTREVAVALGADTVSTTVPPQEVLTPGLAYLMFR